MNRPQAKQQDPEERVQPRCLCEEIVNQVRECLGISPSVREHLMNSRVEFLKAIRAAIDDRIERVAKATQPGTKVPVE